MLTVLVHDTTTTEDAYFWYRVDNHFLPVARPDLDIPPGGSWTKLGEEPVFDQDKIILASKRGPISLRRISPNDTEMVRNWRNSDDVNRYMLTQKYITPEDQERWYQSLDPRVQWQFVIACKNTDVGVINLTEVDYRNGTAVPGIYIADPKHRDGFASFHSSLQLYDIVFYLYNFETMNAVIRPENIAAIRFDSHLGFQPARGENHYELHRDQYRDATRKIRKTLGIEEL